MRKQSPKDFPTGSRREVRRGNRRGPRDDIPVARRSASAAAPPRGGFRRGLGGSLLVIAIAAATLFLFREPLRRQLVPPPVAGLNARLSADGRLLGHFPYPEAPASKLVALSPEIRLRPEAASDLLAMQRAATADGVDLVVLSAFRSLDLQRTLFFDVKAQRNQSSRDRARVSAPPGFSEHSTGFAVDLGDAHRPATNLSPSFDGTPAYRWLAANAARYHFHLSFPRGNSQRVNYEPWHWRYEGSTEALEVFEPAQRQVR